MRWTWCLFISTRGSFIWCHLWYIAVPDTSTSWTRFFPHVLFSSEFTNTVDRAISFYSQLLQYLRSRRSYWSMRQYSNAVCFNPNTSIVSFSSGPVETSVLISSEVPCLVEHDCGLLEDSLLLLQYIVPFPSQSSRPTAFTECQGCVFVFAMCGGDLRSRNSCQACQLIILSAFVSWSRWAQKYIRRRSRSVYDMSLHRQLIVIHRSSSHSYLVGIWRGSCLLHELHSGVAPLFMPLNTADTLWVGPWLHVRLIDERACEAIIMHFNLSWTVGILVYFMLSCRR